MRSLRRLAFLVALVIAGHGAMAADDAPPVSVAIVVHPDTSVSNLTMAQLRRVFLAEQQFWDDDSRITLLVRAPGAYERDVVMDRLYRMDEAQFRKYWIAKMFRAEVPSGPRIVFSTNMAMELVKAIPGSITFVNSQDLDASVKVVTVDGLHPDDEGYSLR
jgi:ABC-type phosphate transport system substrate-binding protein